MTVNLAQRTADVIEFASRSMRRLSHLATDCFIRRRDFFDPRQLPGSTGAQYLAVMRRLVVGRPTIFLIGGDVTESSIERLKTAARSAAKEGALEIDIMLTDESRSVTREALGERLCDLRPLGVEVIINHHRWEKPLSSGRSSLPG